MALRALAALVLGIASRASAAELHVCCGCGSDANNGTTRAAPLNSLAVAQLRARATLPSASAGLTVYVAGLCTLNSTWTLNTVDSGTAANPVVWSSYPDDPRGGPVVSGGAPVPAASLVPVADPAVLARLPAVARGNVLQLNLTAMGVKDAGSLLCHQYLMSITLLKNAGLELFMFGDAFSGGDAGPLQLARYPNRDVNSTGWPTVRVWNNSGNTLTPDVATAARLASWTEQAKYDSGAIMLYLFAFGERG